MNHTTQAGLYTDMSVNLVPLELTTAEAGEVLAELWKHNEVISATMANGRLDVKAVLHDKRSVAPTIDSVRRLVYAIANRVKARRTYSIVAA